MSIPDYMLVLDKPRKFAGSIFSEQVLFSIIAISTTMSTIVVLLVVVISTTTDLN